MNAFTNRIMKFSGTPDAEPGGSRKWGWDEGRQMPVAAGGVISQSWAPVQHKEGLSDN